MSLISTSIPTTVSGAIFVAGKTYQSRELRQLLPEICRHFGGRGHTTMLRGCARLSQLLAWTKALHACSGSCGVRSNTCVTERCTITSILFHAIAQKSPCAG